MFQSTDVTITVLDKRHSTNWLSAKWRSVVAPKTEPVESAQIPGPVAAVEDDGVVVNVEGNPSRLSNLGSTL